MKVDFELSDKDYDGIANKVMQKISDEMFIKTLLKTSEEVAKEKYWHVLEKLHSEIEIHELLDKHMKRHILEGIKENGLLNSELSKVINSEDMKNITAKALRRKAEQLEREAEELEQQDYEN